MDWNQMPITHRIKEKAIEILGLPESEKGLTNSELKDKIHKACPDLKDKDSTIERQICFLKKDPRIEHIPYGVYRLSELNRSVHDVDHIAQDIQEIIKQPNSEPTEKSSLILCRIGQGKFREDLIKLWQECSVTGFKMISLLVASHIKPWADSDNKERLDAFNGLLLLPNIDKAFDKGYISFDEMGTIIISKDLGDFGSLGIKRDMKINIKDENIPYLEYHRTHVFNKLSVK